MLSIFLPHRDDFKKIPPLDAKKLEVFRTVREITGLSIKLSLVLWNINNVIKLQSVI